MRKHVGQIVQPLRKQLCWNVRPRSTECSPFLALSASSWQPWSSRPYLQLASGVAPSWDVLLVFKGRLDIGYLCIFPALGVSPSLDPIYLGLWSYCPLLTAAGCNHTYLYSSEHDIKTQMLQPFLNIKPQVLLPRSSPPLSCAIPPCCRCHHCWSPGCPRAPLQASSLLLKLLFSCGIPGCLACPTSPCPSSWPAGPSCSSPPRWSSAQRSSPPLRSTWQSTRRTGRRCWCLTCCSLSPRSWSLKAPSQVGNDGAGGAGASVHHSLCLACCIWG